MIRLAVRCQPELAERVLTELVELAPGGVEERSGDGWVEYAIYGAPGELPELGALEAAAGEGVVSVEASEVADDWGDRWRRFHRPVRVGERLVVAPSWEPEAGEEAALRVVIDPGRAFGTGAHATTSLCLELLVERADAGYRDAVSDLGCGSGVLGIAAAKLGMGPVWACDSEAAAVEVAVANARRNDVELTVERCDLRRREGAPAPLWLANLTAPILAEVARRITPLERGGPETLIASGMLRGERKRVAEDFEAAGFTVAAARERGEWAALQLTR